jgi:hypothetical protein
MRMSRKRRKQGVLSEALLGESWVQDHIKPGLQGMAGYSTRVSEKEYHVTDSVDFDTASRPQAPQDKRWDYFIGAREQKQRASRECLIGVEVHSATDGEVREVIAKKAASKPLLAMELCAGKSVVRWVWVAHGSVKFSPNSKYRRQLAAARIEFVGRLLTL